jgi:menaquinone-dependent protoporphyrinogen IX oxidase
MKNMKSLTMIYDTKFGNNKKVCEIFAESLKSEYFIQINHAKEVDPKQVAENNPDALIIGGPIRAAMPSLTLKKWIKKFGKALKNHNISAKNVLVYCTGGGNKNNSGNKMLNVVEKNIPVEKLYPTLIYIKMAEIEGPIREGEEEIIQQASQKFLEFIQSP